MAFLPIPAAGAWPTGSEGYTPPLPLLLPLPHRSGASKAGASPRCLSGRGRGLAPVRICDVWIGVYACFARRGCCRWAVLYSCFVGWLVRCTYNGPLHTSNSHVVLLNPNVIPVFLILGCCGRFGVQCTRRCSDFVLRFSFRGGRGVDSAMWRLHSIFAVVGPGMT